MDQVKHIEDNEKSVSFSLLKLFVDLIIFRQPEIQCKTLYESLKYLKMMTIQIITNDHILLLFNI